VASGIWRATGRTWTLSFGDDQVPERSSLVFGPIDLPVNADIVRLNIQFQMALSVDLGGNVKASDDGGATWSVLVPDVPYDQAFDAGSPHVMNGESVFTGVYAGARHASFDLHAYNGRQVWLRVDFGAARSLATTEFWRLDEAALQTSTLTPVEGGFQTPRELALHPNFPNPFSATTTLSFTLPRPMHARLEIYDLLARRVARLVDDSRPAGTYVIPFDAGGLAAGVYLMRLEADGQEQVARMVVVH
jgi:hypothetical protein